MDVPGRWAGGFRAWDEHGVYLATGRGVDGGPGAPGAGRGAARAGPTPGSRSAGTSSRGCTAPRGPSSRRRGSASALVTLGTLAAGLAHEINNPAAAATRAVDALEARVSDAARRRSAGSPTSEITAAQFAALDELRREIEPAGGGPDPLALRRPRGGAVDLAGAARRRRATGSIAPPLAAAGVDVDWCERAAAVLDGTALRAGAGVGGEHVLGGHAAGRGEGVDPADLRARRRGQVLLADGPGVDAARST